MRNSPLRAFASPLKQDKKAKSKKKTKSKDKERVKVERTTEVIGTKEDEKNLRKSMESGGLGKEGMKSLLDDF